MSKDPLIFFVHIPKTAGSTINRYAEEHFDPMYKHCEAYSRDQDKFLELAKTSQFMSGHLQHLMVDRMLKEVGRDIHFYTCLRNPVKQVMSHLNWLIEIQNRGPAFFYSHPENIQKLSFMIRSNGLKNVYDVMYILLSHKTLFLNCQSMYLFGKTPVTPASIKGLLNKFTYIGTEEKVDQLLLKMTGKEIEHVDRVNASNYHFDRMLFEDEELLQFLEIHNAADNLLYRQVLEATS